MVLAEHRGQDAALLVSVGQREDLGCSQQETPGGLGLGGEVGQMVKAGD